MHLLKCALGTGIVQSTVYKLDRFLCNKFLYFLGIFAMPNAFNHAGYVVGVFGTIALGSIATYCVHMIVNLHYDLCKWKKVCNSFCLCFFFIVVVVIEQHFEKCSEKNSARAH